DKELSELQGQSTPLKDKERELSELQGQSTPLKENLAKGMTGYACGPDKEKELSELQWQSRPLKENLAKGMTRADAQLQNDLRDDEARLATVTHAVAQHSAARTLAKVTRT
ncbi:hypothetical protein T484DRAFT_1867400, partial [Baffinella frigidus]